MPVSAEGVGRHYGARSAGGLLDAYLIADGDRATVPGVTVADRPLLMTDPDRTAAMVAACARLPGWPVVAEPPTPDSPAPAPAGLQLLPVTGLPEFRPGDDLAGAIAAAAPWLRDGDVLLVTSKVVSKVEGRLIPSPTDPDERDALRRRLIDDESVRLVAQIGRTKIVENRLGIVAAAAGIDASNVMRRRDRPAPR